MDELLNFLFSVIFVLIGSLAFHISALVSGDDIYRDLPTLEATLVSTVAGIVIFLLSPISFIIFSNFNACYVNTLVQILDFKVLLAFFGCAFGLGLIFGSLTILKARVTILDWFRDKSEMRFWISSYGIVWDAFLGGVKRKGEVFVQTDSKMFKGSLVAFSIRNEQREIVLGKYKTIKTDGSEEDMDGITKDEKNADVLIPESKIKRIMVPERSFKKHYEPMGHISQAFYSQLSAIGFFFLSYSAKLTGNYVQNELNLIIDSLDFFYYVLTLSFLALTVFVLCVSVWVAQKDFDNLQSFGRLSPDIIFMTFFFLLTSISFILYITHVSHIVILIFLLSIITLLYIYKIRNWLRKPIKVSFDRIKRDFNDEQDFKKVIQCCYLQLSCNDKSKAHISDIAAEIYENDEDVRRWLESDDYYERRRLEETYKNVKKVSILIAEIERLKKCEYFKNEDFNIILTFRNYLKKEDC